MPRKASGEDDGSRYPARRTQRLSDSENPTRAMLVPKCVCIANQQFNRDRESKVALVYVRTTRAFMPDVGRNTPFRLHKHLVRKASR